MFFSHIVPSEKEDFFSLPSSLFCNAAASLEQTGTNASFVTNAKMLNSDGGTNPSAPSGAFAVARTSLNAVGSNVPTFRNSPVILSAMILDFFGSFFSSANTLLPFVAMDILHVGPIQYGWLSASQSIGTMLVGLYLSQRARLGRQGMLISLSVAGFGLATVLFGLSTSFWLTMLALILVGAFDGLSSIIRNTVRQLLTPDEMRGRMMSITQIFFKGGPQLGEMESGFLAQLIGVPLSIISGGVGCLAATWLVVKRFPELWKYNGSEAVSLATMSQERTILHSDQ